MTNMVTANSLFSAISTSDTKAAVIIVYDLAVKEPLYNIIMSEWGTYNGFFTGVRAISNKHNDILAVMETDLDADYVFIV